VRTTDKYLFFWGGTFSNWHPSFFVIDGVTYDCVEQFYMSKKALMFRDYESLEKIMRTPDPAKQKAFGREVKNFDADRWKQYSRDIMYDGLYGKFSQNKILAEQLVSVKQRFVEASPYDCIWGVGLGINDDKIDDEKNWRGLNWLGELLDIVRVRIIIENK
jgi:ribA/ribD-fused uncharacterized protein